MKITIFNCMKTEQDTGSSIHLYKQAIAVFVSSLLGFSGGLTVGITAALLPQLEENEEFYWMKEYSSWIASLAPISSILSCLCIGRLLDRFGRKAAHLMLAFPFTIGWLCMAFANDFYIMIIGRFLTGFSYGSVKSVSIIYLGEISDPKYRGIFLVLPSLSANLGVLFSHILGSVTVWRTALFICIFPNLIMFAMHSFFKESPYWLISKGRTVEGTDSFRWFRGTGDSAESELRDVIEKQKSKGTELTIKELLKIVSSRSFVRPIITLIFIFVAVQFNGVNSFPFYANDLIEAMFEEKIDTFLVLMIMDVIRVVVCIFICLVGKNMRRRASFLYCAYATVLLLVGLAAVRFYEKEVPARWIPLTLLIFFTGIACVLPSLGWTFIALRFTWTVSNENLGSDHLMVFISSELSFSQTITQKRNFKHADWPKYREILTDKLKNIDFSKNSQQIYTDLLLAINYAANEAIPLIKICSDPTSKFSPKPYWTPELSRAVAMRRRALAQLRKNATPANLLIFKQKTAEAQKVIRKAQADSFRKFCDSIGDTISSSEMWNKMRWLKGYRNVKKCLDFEEANTFLRRLTPEYVLPQPPSFTSFNAKLEIPITLQELKNTLKRYDTAPGADDISYSMIYHFPKKQVLVDIFNRCISEGQVPEQWRDIKVIPIPKPGRDANSISSLRPISLISCLCKTLHNIITRRLEWYFESNDLFSNNTVGFRRTQSCIDNLVRLVTQIQIGFSEKQQTLACLVDIDNAYNNVNVAKLVSKLDEMGVGSSLCKYIWEFLKERHITIAELENNCQIVRWTWLGLAQGDPMSPILFNIVTSDICKEINNVYISQYADDFVLYVSGQNLTFMSLTLQEALDSLTILLDDLGLELSPSKSKLCMFSRGRSLRQVRINIKDISLENVTIVKYLGLWLDQSMRWNKQINELCEKTYKFLNVFNILAGSSWGVHPTHLRRLYIATVRSRLDFACFLFDNSAKTNVNKIDKVQNQALRVIGGFIKSSPIHAMESELCLPPLFLRRRYLAFKFWLKAKSMEGGETISAITRLASLCDCKPYWNNNYLNALKRKK